MDNEIMDGLQTRNRAEELVADLIVSALEKHGLAAMRSRISQINVKIEIRFGLKEGQKEPTQDKLCDVKGLGDYLNMSKSAIYKLVNERRIPFYHIGSRVRFDLDKVKKWLEKAEYRGRLTRRIPVE